MSVDFVPPPGSSTRGPMRGSASPPGRTSPSVDRPAPAYPSAPTSPASTGSHRRTLMDWSGLVTGNATTHNAKLRDRLGRLDTCSTRAASPKTTASKSRCCSSTTTTATSAGPPSSTARTACPSPGNSTKVDANGSATGGDCRSGSPRPASFPATARPTGTTAAKVFELSICERGAHHPHSYLEVVTDIALAA